MAGGGGVSFLCASGSSRIVASGRGSFMSFQEICRHACKIS